MRWRLHNKVQKPIPGGTKCRGRMQCGAALLFVFTCCNTQAQHADVMHGSGNSLQLQGMNIFTGDYQGMAGEPVASLHAAAIKSTSDHRQLKQVKSLYELTWETDGWLMASATVITIADQVLRLTTTTADMDRSTLDANSVNGFDRVAIGLHSEWADFRSDLSLFSSAVLSSFSVALHPLTTRNTKAYISEFITLSVMWMETNLITYYASGITKKLVRRPRPEMYDLDYHIKADPSEREDLYHSFFSRHVSVAAANSFFFARVFSDYYPESPLKPLAWAGAVAIPVWTGLERIFAGKHFPTDVISGYAFGAACGILVPQLHVRKPGGESVTLYTAPFASPFGAGMQLSLRF